MTDAASIIDIAPKEPEPTDWAYAAGIVDGEGCIAITRAFNHRGKGARRFVYSTTVIVVNCDRSLLDWMCGMWAGKVVQSGKGNVGDARRSWAWRSPVGLGVLPFLAGIRPWLRVKRAQCDNAMSMINVQQLSRRTLGQRSLPPELQELQERHYWIQRQLNHRGRSEFVMESKHTTRKPGRPQMAIASSMGPGEPPSSSVRSGQDNIG